MTRRWTPSGFDATRTDLVQLSTPAVLVSPSTLCPEVDALFQRDPTLTSLVLRDHHGRWGLVSRWSLAQTMTGRLGYGRVLHQRRAVATVADWDPLVLDDSIGLVEAASLVAMRGVKRWQDVLVRTASGLRVATAGAVIEALAGAFMDRAVRDDLTGLPNRAAFFDHLHSAWARRAAAQDDVLALVFIDLDDFKGINDGHGHDAGDEALRAVARALATAARADDVVARLGGDEFAVLVVLPPGTTVRDRVRSAALLADRFRLAVVERAGVCASVGVALAGPSGDAGATGGATGVAGPGVAEEGIDEADGEAALRAADLAMYVAKNAGGDRVVVADPALGHLTLGVDGTLERDPDTKERDALVEAIAQDQLTLHYQPIVRLSDGRPASIEALVRWEHPGRGLLGPGHFLPAIDRLGLSADLDFWVLDHALSDFSGWLAERLPGLPPCVNVNLSRQVLGDAQLHERVMALLRRYELPPTALRLELVEDTDPELLARAEPQLHALRSEGVALTWDDMGSGSSSLRQVTQLSVDGLKIDRSFVSRMLDSESDRAVVRMLIQLARAMDLMVTAEGIETPEQLQMVTELGAGHAQGFLLGAPTARSALPDLLRHLAPVDDTAVTA